MKKQRLTFIYFIVALISITTSAQKKVFASFKTLTTQSEVDAFGSENYTHIEGWMKIEGDDITNLDALNTITNIRHSLSILNNPNLENINGLSKIDSIAVGQFSDQLKIKNNPKIENLEGLQGLIETSSIEIFSNVNLASIYGLRNVDRGLRKIHITGNDKLESLYGLHNISVVSGTVWISENKKLINLAGLENLKSINSKFWIIENINLENLNALSNLEFTDGLWVTKNEKLNNFCGLTKLVNSNLPSSFTSTIGNNLYNPNIDNIKNGNCSNSTNFSLEYPKENDVYIVGRKIRLQFPDNVGIPTNSEINLSYSFDNTTWIEGGSYIADSNLGEFLVAPDVTDPKGIFIKIETSANGNDLSFTRENIIIQPVNYYEDLGFKEDGVSEIDFPFNGYFNDDSGWLNVDDVGFVPNSEAHICWDKNAQDWNYASLPLIECGKIVKAPFDGTILHLQDTYDGKLCNGLNSNENEGPGKNIVIQSSDNKVFAMQFAHLKLTNIDLYEGKEVTKGDYIGKVGGTGTPSTHVHVSLHKNIYEWFPLFLENSKTYIKGSFIDFIKKNKTYFGGYTEGSTQCISDTNSFSVKFNFYSNNNIYVYIGAQVIENKGSLSQFLSNQFISIGGDLVINYNESKSSKTFSKLNNSINSLKGLETIQSIDGDLRISNTDISSLEGLENLSFIGGNLIIENNTNLSDFCGLYNLLKNDGILGDVIINNNLENPTESEILDSIDCQNTLKITSLSIKEINIFPNPTKNYITLKNLSSGFEVKLFSTTGKLILKDKNIKKISLDNLKSGIYMLRISTNESLIIKKIVKL